TVISADPANHRGLDAPPPQPVDIHVEKFVNAPAFGPDVAVGPLDADTAPGVTLRTGRPVFWTYEVTNPGLNPLSGVTVRDDAGTPGTTADDFTPTFLGGDEDGDGLLDPGEVWHYTSAGVRAYTVVAGQYTNLGTATGTGPTGTSVSAADPANHFGTATPPADPVAVTIQKAVNAANPLQPTPLEDANDPNNPRPLTAGTNVVWTYLVRNPGTTALSNVRVVDDNGTTGPADDFVPRYVGGDTDGDSLLDPGEVWLYTSAGVFAFQAPTILYGNFGTVTATGNGTAVTHRDPAYLIGTAPGVIIKKAVNAANPDAPTPAEEADAAPGRELPVGTPVVWTYRVMSTTDEPVAITSIKDDAGTPADPTDDFTPVYLYGDADADNLLDPGEVWLYTSAGVGSAPTGPRDWNQLFEHAMSATVVTGPGGFVHDPVNSPSTDDIFTGGGSKDTRGIGDWKWKTFSPQDKDDIADSFGVSYAEAATGRTLMFAGLDRFAANGDATIGFWFFQNAVGKNANGTFSGTHTDGDLLLVVDFRLGGA
ncbi:MAG TPA: hypothetical protein VM597_19605, partial [Gemmataceae bacterium]|nr:hypothetical protein [Gemmataceae bacterium]